MTEPSMCICELPISDRHNELLGGKGGRVLGWREGTTGSRKSPRTTTVAASAITNFVVCFMPVWFGRPDASLYAFVRMRITETTLHHSASSDQIMRKLMKEAAEIAGGLVICVAAFFISSLPTNPAAGVGPGWGFPFVWRVTGTGLPVPQSFLGVHLGVVNSVALTIDLVFWIILSLAVVEASSRLAIPYLRRRQ